MDYDVFISYATTDGLSFAKAVAGFLRRKYFLSVYLAEEEDRSGESVDAKVREAILAAGKVILLFTPEAISSAWVRGEVSLALETKKRLIICRKEDVNRGQLPIPVMEKDHTVFSDADSLINSLDKEAIWGIPMIVPAAGRSGGLYPLNLGMPKILLPVGKKPILHHIIDKLDPSVFSGVIILTGMFSEMIEYYAGLSDARIPVRCQRTPHPLLPMALKEMNFQTSFMVHYSDIIIEGDFDWRNFVEHHKHNRNMNNVIGTLMASNRYKLPVGRIRTGGQQIITEFTEKPDNIESVGYSINMAVSMFEPEFLTHVKDDDVSLYGQTVKRAMEDKKKFCLYEHDTWRHIQTLGDWYEAQRQYVPGEEDSFLKDVSSSRASSG